MSKLTFAIGSAAIGVSLSFAALAEARLDGGGSGRAAGAAARVGAARSGGGGGGINRPSGGGNLPNRPNVGGGNINLPNRPNAGGGINVPNRPGAGGGNINLPNRPGAGTGGDNLPNRPGTGGGINVPNRPGGGNINLPERPGAGGGINLPNRPGTGGGINLPDRPSVNRPDRPGTGGGINVPNRPGGGNINLPERPGAGGGINLPNRPGTGGGTNLPDRPRSLPDRPGTGGGINLPDRPGIARPDRPGAGIDLPNRPGRPSLGGSGAGTLPNRPGSSGRPSTGDLGDFLGIGRPIQPGISRRDTVINNRPTWVNIDNRRHTEIRNNINVQVGGIRNWQVDHRHRIDVRRGWGNSVRIHWSHRSSGWSSSSWRIRDSRFQPVWRHQIWFPVQPWRFWWRRPTFVSTRNWFVWAPQHLTVWRQPVYFDYGPGGNLYFEGDAVFMNGEPIATAEEFVQSAMELATVPPPESEEQARQAEWMPLGTFAVSTDAQDVDPTRVIQLAVDREGIVSGTMFNDATDEADPVQGQVDRETQRVAIRVGESETFVLETGLYNLTQDEAPVFAHFGTERTESWLFVRLQEPEGDAEASLR